jgi:hypothetical protein
VTTTIVRVRRTVALDGKPALTFAVDGLPSDDRMLGLDPGDPLIDALLQFQSTPDEDSDVIANAGSAIHQHLATHANMVQALAATLNAPVNVSSRAIRIHIEPVAKLAHNLPWETLLHPGNGFIALSDGIPFSRTLPPVNPDLLRTEGTFDGTLKLAAVLAAAGIPGTPQWKAIAQALTGWPAGQFECLLLVDRPEFKVQIEAEAAAAGLAGITVELVPNNVDALVLRIGDFAPHILHLFCHGMADGGGVLEIATANSAFGQPPLYLRPAPLASAARSSWLVILNACSTGAADAAAETNSIACSLVEQGVPFVTSMRQQVEAVVANRFATAFLTRLLHDIRLEYDKGGRFELQISPSVVAARRTIMESYGPATPLQRRFKEWTLPILCASQVPFHIHPVTVISQQMATETLAAIRVLRAILASGAASKEKRQAIEAHIAQLEQLIV